MKSQYINRYGLLNSKLEEDVAENSPLWSIELYLLTGDESHLHNVVMFIDKCRTSELGLYHQRPEKENNGTKDDYMSPDQLIAFVAALHKNNRNKNVKEIWNYLWKHFFTYDNLQPGKINKERLIQIGAVCFVGVLAGHKSLYPILATACVYSCWIKQAETSGKIKSWVMFNVAEMKLTKKICNLIIKYRSEFVDWVGIFQEYFPRKDHPIYIEVNDIKNGENNAKFRKEI